MTTMALLSPARAHRAPALNTITVAYTPDSDDAFNFYAWEHDRVTVPGLDTRFRRAHIRTLNDAAIAGLHDVVAISSVIYPQIANRYWILAPGASVGRGYGPVLVGREPLALEDTSGKRIAFAGPMTTGGYLARRFCPDAEFVTAPYDTIAKGILDGDFDAGVMIHEELVHFPAMGLHRICDLGAHWSDETGLPLPVGLSVVRKSLGRDTAHEIARASVRSLQWALDHMDESLAYARSFGRGCADSFVPMFSNTDTLLMPHDVRQGLRALFDQIADAGLGPRVDTIEVIDA
jgi:1,4-dihydroxy-6-naphthoate synthase